MTPSLGDGRVVAQIKDFSDAVVAECCDVNPLAGGDPAPSVADAPVRVVWSGRAPGDETGVRTWGPAGWAAFLGWCDRIEPRLAGGGAGLWIRPHAEHVLSDAQRCFTFLRERDGGGVGVLLDPVSMLTGPMMAHAHDHLGRILEALCPLPAVRALLLSGGSPPGAPPGFDESLGALVRSHWAREKPVVLNGAGAERFLDAGAVRPILGTT